MPESALTSVTVVEGDCRSKLGQVYFAPFVKDNRTTGVAEWTVTSVSFAAGRTTVTAVGREVTRDADVSFGNNIDRLMG